MSAETTTTAQTGSKGQKLLLVGITMFRPDVPPALVSAKFESLKVVGILLTSAGVAGALLGKMEMTGVHVTVPDDIGTLVPSIGENRLDRDYLSHLADNVAFVNIGVATVPADVTDELLGRKIKTYINVGETVAPAPLLGLLKARCPTNLGEFSEPKAAANEQEEQAEAATDAGAEEAAPALAGGHTATGIVQGVPGKKIKAVGVLDLRGVPAEKVAEIEEIEAVGVILVDAQNKLALAKAAVKATGTVMEVDADTRVMVQPWLEISRATMEAM